jgi:sialate O-acetylesterase
MGAGCTTCASGFQDNDGDGLCAPACGSESCSDHGECDDNTGDAICTCRPDFTGEDCATPCQAGMAGTSCEFRIIFGVNVPIAATWHEVADVPYDIDDAASAVAFDRVAYRLILDDEEVWVETDPVSNVAADLGMPVDVLHDAPVLNVTVLSFAANQASIAIPETGAVEMWSNCYSEGLNGVHDYDDDVGGAVDCYGSMQVHVGTHTILAINRWATGGGDWDIGIGNSPIGNPDYTFRQNAGDYAQRRLEVYIREP